MTSNLALALQLNHEENLQQQSTKPDSKSLDSQTTHSLTDSQIFDTISAGKHSLISDKTSKCNLFLGESPVPCRGGRDSPLPCTGPDSPCTSHREGAGSGGTVPSSPQVGAQSPRGAVLSRTPVKKDSASSLRADNISNFSYSVWERGSIGTNELASLSDVSSLCNLICMETGRSGVMSRSHSPNSRQPSTNSPTPSARSRNRSTHSPSSTRSRNRSSPYSSRSRNRSAHSPYSSRFRNRSGHSPCAVEQGEPEVKSTEEDKEKKDSRSVSLRVFALLLDNVNVQRKYLHMKSNSLPDLR